MTEIVERIARVICCPDGCRCAKEDQPPCNLAVLDAGGFAYEARKVLTALRDVPDFILGALHGCAPDTPDKFARAVALEQWQRAIDAALAGAPAARPSPGTESTER